MRRDTIYSFKSLLTIKERIKFLINCKFEHQSKIIKINNDTYLKERTDFYITKYFKDSYTLKTTNLMSEERLPILINHAIFNSYIKKYSIRNKYLIANIGEFYRLTKSFIKMFNKKYFDNIPHEIEINHDVVFSILKYNEQKLISVKDYKTEKVENVFTDELFNIIRRL